MFPADDVLALVIVMFICALLMWITPSCGHRTCADAHQAERVKEAKIGLEKDHTTFHTKDRPQDGCPWC